MSVNEVDDNESNLIDNNDLKIGHLILLQNHPCEINYIAYSKTGKHGIAKMLINGNDIFNGKKYEDILKRCDKIELLKIVTSSYFVTNLNNNTLYALDEKYNQEIQIDLVSENLQKKVTEYLENMDACIVTILSYKNLHKIIKVQKNNL